jgi:hypothetical protein
LLSLTDVTLLSASETRARTFAADIPVPSAQFGARLANIQALGSKSQIRRAEDQSAVRADLAPLARVAGRGSRRPALVDLSCAVAEPQTLRLDALKRVQAPDRFVGLRPVCVRQHVAPPTHGTSFQRSLNEFYALAVGYGVQGRPTRALGLCQSGASKWRPPEPIGTEIRLVSYRGSMCSLG